MNQTFDCVKHPCTSLGRLRCYNFGVFRIAVSNGNKTKIARPKV